MFFIIPKIIEETGVEVLAYIWGKISEKDKSYIDHIFNRMYLRNRLIILVAGGRIELPTSGL